MPVGPRAALGGPLDVAGPDIGGWENGKESSWTTEQVEQSKRRFLVPTTVYVEILWGFYFINADLQVFQL